MDYILFVLNSTHENKIWRPVVSNNITLANRTGNKS